MKLISISRVNIFLRPLISGLRSFHLPAMLLGATVFTTGCESNPKNMATENKKNITANTTSNAPITSTYTNEKLVVTGTTGMTLEEVGLALNKSVQLPKVIEFWLDGKLVLKQENTFSEGIQGREDLHENFIYMIPETDSLPVYPILLAKVPTGWKFGIHTINVVPAESLITPTVASPEATTRNSNSITGDQIGQYPPAKTHTENTQQAEMDEFISFTLKDYKSGLFKDIMSSAKNKAKNRPIALSVMAPPEADYAKLVHLIQDLDALGVNYSMITGQRQLYDRFSKQNEAVEDSILSLPSRNGKEDKRSEIDAIHFVVGKDGSIHRITENGKELLKVTEPKSVQRISRQIRKYKAMAAGEAEVKITADQDTKAQHVVDLLNVLASEGITKITFTEETK